MTRTRTLGVMVGSAALALSMGVATAVAQDEAPAEPMDSMADMTVEVTGVEYAYSGLPDTLPVGSTLTFTNEGIELHELILIRIADDVTESFEEILAMSEEGTDPMEAGLIEMVGEEPLIAEPGQTAEGSLTVDREGRYVALCFIPQGFVPETLAGFGVTEDMPEEEWPPEAQAIRANPPHVFAGMVQELTVVAAEGDGTDEAA